MIGRKVIHPEFKEGIILQACMYMPEYHKIKEKGPYYYVDFHTQNTQWFHIDKIKEYIETPILMNLKK